MSIDLSKVTAISDQYGSYAKIEDASGRVLWMVPSASVPIVLEVEKITSDTYAAETTYTGEQFILLDIYPKTNGTVKVTYGGLTKTLAFSGTNAKQVFFGTFNGVADTTETPASGTLIIDGGCDAIGRGAYQTSSKSNSTKYCDCIVAISDSGGMTYIPNKSFGSSSASASTVITSVNLSDEITSIGAYAFKYCYSLKSVSIQSGEIGMDAFGSCSGLTSLDLAEGVISIGTDAFSECNALESVTIPSSVNSWGTRAFSYCDSLKIVTVKCPTVGEDAFSLCKALTNLTLAEGVTTIEDGAFSSCDALANVTIPSSVTHIGTTAFYAPIIGSDVGTNRIYTVLPTTPPTLGQTALDVEDDDVTISIIVPKGCGDIYKVAEGWSTYADKIVEAA